ncbi:hypothetical protein F4779DRAFT_565175 [Xylariaceae sp. FL0662B]|nr:hypothetical protein F4779DRAFT_565175 [Xylariaceae sp. FL0662B]
MFSTEEILALVGLIIALPSALAALCICSRHKRKRIDYTDGESLIGPYLSLRPRLEPDTALPLYNPVMLADGAYGDQTRRVLMSRSRSIEAWVQTVELQ